MSTSSGLLRELPRVQQVAGEPRRRWFHADAMDLVLWQAEDGAIVGFQLAYDKHRDEHSLSWHRERGFRHWVVDDGEVPSHAKETPLLYADGAFDRDRVLPAFVAAAADLPPEIAGFVADRLREFDGRG